MSENDERHVGDDSDRLTVLERLRAGGVSDARALHHLKAEYVRVAGQVVIDPAAAAPRSARVVLQPRA